MPESIGHLKNLANNPKFCDSKICPARVERQNLIKILPASRGNPGFFAVLFYKSAKFRIPRKTVQTLIEFVRTTPPFARGGFFYRKIRDNWELAKFFTAYLGVLGAKQ